MLDVTGITKAYDSFRLGPLDLAVDDEVVAVLGPSGCGKTTLLSLIAGFTSPDGGTAVLDGRRLDGRPPEERGAVLVFQEGALFPHMTARENIAYAAAESATVEELSEALEVRPLLDQQAGTLSGGEAQRVALARALAADPDALLLDEPLANLDAPIKRRLRDDLRELLASVPIPVVYVTHDQTEASAVGDRIAVMRAGQIEQIGPARDVFARPTTPFVASFTGGTNVLRGRLGDDHRIHWGPYRFETTISGYEAGDSVRFCVRPEYVEIAGDPSSAENAVTVRVVSRIFEGSTYRLVVRPVGTETSLEVTVLAPVYENRHVGDRDRLTITVPADAIHLVGDRPHRNGGY